MSVLFPFSLKRKFRNLDKKPVWAAPQELLNVNNFNGLSSVFPSDIQSEKIDHNNKRKSSEAQLIGILLQRWTENNAENMTC